MYILENFCSPSKLLDADKEILVQTIAKLARNGYNWALKKYNARYIFAVLRDEEPFRLITPEEHLKAFEKARLNSSKISA